MIRCIVRLFSVVDDVDGPGQLREESLVAKVLLKQVAPSGRSLYTTIPRGSGKSKTKEFSSVFFIGLTFSFLLMNRHS